MVDPMKGLNLLLAALGSLAAFGALNKMHVSSTRPCIIGAILLIALGLAGQWLSLLHEEWLMYVDAALYGGVLALIVASQRHHTWFLERWANPIASAIVVTVGFVFVGGLLSGCAAAEKLPPCERWNFSVVRQDGEPVGIMLNPERLMQLHSLITGLAAGKCRIPEPGERRS